MTPKTVIHYITSLNALRGLAALAVVLFHLKSVIDCPLGESFFSRGYLAVDLFFILSGFVLMHVYQTQFERLSTSGYWKFVSNRFARIYPVHLVVLLFWICFEGVKWLLSASGHLEVNQPLFIGPTSGFAVVTNLLLIQAWHFHDTVTWNGPAWSISSEWFVYLFAPLLISIFVRLANPMKAIAAFILADAALWLLTFAPNGLDSTFDFGNLRMLFEFCMGLSVYHLYHWIRQVNLSASRMFDVWTWCVLGLMLWAFLSGVSDYALVQCYALLIPCCALSTGLIQRALSSRPMFYLGEISYSLYMTHGIIIYILMMKIGQRWPTLTLWQFTGLALITLVLSLVLAHLSYKYLEIPARDYLRKKLTGIPLPRWIQNTPSSPSVPPAASRVSTLPG